MIIHSKVVQRGQSFGGKMRWETIQTYDPANSWDDIKRWFFTDLDPLDKIFSPPFHYRFVEEMTEVAAVWTPDMVWGK